MQNIIKVKELWKFSLTDLGRGWTHRVIIVQISKGRATLSFCVCLRQLPYLSVPVCFLELVLKVNLMTQSLIHLQFSAYAY